MLNINFHENRWKSSTAILILLIHLFFVSVLEIINKTSLIFTHARNNVQGYIYGKKFG